MLVSLVIGLEAFLCPSKPTPASLPALGPRRCPAQTLSTGFLGLQFFLELTNRRKREGEWETGVFPQLLVLWVTSAWLNWLKITTFINIFGFSSSGSSSNFLSLSFPGFVEVSVHSRLAPRQGSRSEERQSTAGQAEDSNSKWRAMKWASLSLLSHPGYKSLGWCLPHPGWSFPLSRPRPLLIPVSGLI